MDRFKVRVGVIGISPGAGESFVAGGLNYYLNEKDAPKVFVSKPEKYEIIDGPSDLTDLDLIVGVIDPLPSRIEEGAPRFAVLSQRDNVIWLVNKDNPGVNHRELRGFLELEPSFSQEALPYEKICRAGYNCEKIPEMYELTGIEKLADHIRKLC